ncbi:Transmembrane protein 72 [Oryzias melastigma]|uniref:Transmembrane protein 72 n=1 Tax=Oryzias melastigma TaxID=30732 RepID=A0A834FED7_ORYME|nr:Transmembrane protein 72 [Oryzias melastigma]
MALMEFITLALLSFIHPANVLCAVGVETVERGEFNSLGIYLIASSVAIMMFELAYYLDALLSMCLPCPPDWQLFVLWRKMAHVGGFHKFLYYFIMSVVCFLHPVLVWHAIIPGSMLLVTAIFNFILSKKAKCKDIKISHVCHSNQDLTTLRDAESSDSNSSFLHAKTGRKEEGLALSDRERHLSPEDRCEHTQTMLDKTQTPPSDNTGKTRWTWKDRRLTWFRGREKLVEKEMEEMEVYCEPETTSDTAPMITD